uniref:Uncharacterized protein n=1 Tax=Meloidogyne enterolobii TaxID=390850 RepID=A0A6V7UZB6_MELEN|nr:unnamed protein product [Meloidogyne enterolobii]
MNKTKCLAAEASVINISYNIVRALHLLLGMIVLLMLLRLVWTYKTKSLKLHPNIILIISNILIIYMLLVFSFMGAAIKNFIVLFTYTNPCDCLIKVWTVYLFRIIPNIYNFGLSLLHFALMIERIFATIYVKIYEKQGKMFGIISTIMGWTSITIFAIYVYISSSMDIETFKYPMPYLSLTSIYNSQILFKLHYFYLFLVICIAFADYYLIRRNQKIKSNFSTTDYSLSQSYQAKQNILVMRIIFPLDFSYTFVFAVFNILSFFIRSLREDYGILAYVRNYDAIFLLPVIHIIITLFVYEYFLKKQDEINHNFIQNRTKNNTEIYFKRLHSQWN